MCCSQMMVPGASVGPHLASLMMRKRSLTHTCCAQFGMLYLLAAASRGGEAPGKTACVRIVCKGAPSACCVPAAVAMAVPEATLCAQACLWCCTGGGQNNVQGVVYQVVMPGAALHAQACAFLLQMQQRSLS